MVQIRETGQGIYPPVLYQPLRSPKSPYAKIGQGTSCTLPVNFPFELKVQIRPCFDEKILKKNLSQDNLLRADYISRPNEKCTLRDTQAYVHVHAYIYNHDCSVLQIVRLVKGYILSVALYSRVAAARTRHLNAILNTNMPVCAFVSPAHCY